MPMYQIVLIVLSFIGMAIYAFMMNKKTKAGAAAYLEQYPDAATITPKMKAGIKTEAVLIESVDGEKPNYGGKNPVYRDAGQYFVYAAPGTRILEASFSSTRPGVMHKSVTKTWGPVKLEVDIKPNGRYELQFDKDTESFQLVEI